MRLFVDADACPTKDEILKIVARYSLAVFFVANQWMRLPQSNLIQQIVVDTTPDAADDWIAEAIEADEICITADIELAARCLKKGAHILNHAGQPFDEDNIAMAQSMRDLNSMLRETGEIKGHNKSLSAHDRSRFLSALNNLVEKYQK